MTATVTPLERLEPEAQLKVQGFSASLKWVVQGDCRLDASFHADEAVSARRTLAESDVQIITLGDSRASSEIFNMPRFKRIYTSDPSRGYPYLGASDAISFRPERDRFIAMDQAPRDRHRYFAKPGWLLITCSGVVGRCALVTKRLERFFLTHDLMRIVPALPGGYLYVYMSSWIGQALMAKEQYGMTVTHLEPQHFANLPVPLLSAPSQLAMHEEILRAYALRDEANNLLDEAQKHLHQGLGLPGFDASSVPNITRLEDENQTYRCNAFSIRAWDLSERLDASFHNPEAKACVEAMHKGRFPVVQLGSLARCYVPPRFRRVYVSAKHGVPFLQGSHVPMMKPYDLKHLSRRAHADLSRWIVEQGWVLLTCSGTIGRALVVPRALDGWAASQHIERIIAHEGRANPGYIAAFLMSTYGQVQLRAKVHGAVVDEITEADTAAIWVPDAPLAMQARIGTPVVEAFEKKEEANTVEQAAIRKLEEEICN